jgi:hypothetical protein
MHGVGSQCLKAQTLRGAKTSKNHSGVTTVSGTFKDADSGPPYPLLDS